MSLFIVWIIANCSSNKKNRSPVIDHRPIETEIRQPTLTATNTVKSYKDFETRSSLELKKDKSSDEWVYLTEDLFK